MSTQEIKVKASVDVDVQNAQAQLANLESQSTELRKKIASVTTEYNQRMSRSMQILENNLNHMMSEQISTTPYSYGKDAEKQRQIRNKYINEKMTAREVLKTAQKPLGLMEKMNMARLEKQSAKGTISSSGSSTLKALQKRQEYSGLMSLYMGDKETKSLAKANEAYLREVQEANAKLGQLAARRKEIIKNFPSLAPQTSSSYVPTSKSITSTKMERPDSVYQRRQAEIRKELAQEMKAAREANIGKKYQIGKTTSIGTHSFKGSDGKDIAYPAVYSSALTGLKYTTSTGKQKEVTGETAVSKRILDELYKRNQTAANGESAQTIIDRIFSDLSRAIDQIDTGNIDTQTLSQLESVIRNFAGYKEGGPEFARKSQGLRENFNKIKNSMIQWQTQMQSEAGDMQSDDSEAVEFRKWQQSQEQKYVTDETDQQAFARKQQEYIDEFVSQYQKEAGTTEKRKHTGLTWSDVAKSIRLDPANKYIKQSVPYNVNQDGEIEGVQEENISAMLKNIMRFSVAGEVVGGNAEAQYFLGDSQKDALSVMQKLTAHLRSNPKVAQALDGKGGYGSNEQLLSLLEEMQKMYVSFLEGYNDNQMDGGIKSQIKTRLSEISQVLGNADMNGGLSKEAVETIVKDLSPQSNRAVRSITAKMGKATGKYPRGLVGMGGLPVQYTGGMPFMPDKENIGDNLESNFKTIEGRTELLKQFAFRAEDLKAKIAGTSDTTQQQALTTELDAVIKALNEVFNTLYSSSDPLVKNGLSASQQSGLEQIKTTGFGFVNGQIKSFDQMGESDFDSANSTQLKSMIEYFQNQIKQIAPKNNMPDYVADYHEEVEAITALLRDYAQEVFTQSDMDEILSHDDTMSASVPSVNFLDLGVDSFPWEKNADGEYQVTRKQLEERAAQLDAIVDSGIDPERAGEDPRYKELLSIVDGLKLKLESKLKEEEGQAIDSELQSFANKYASASSGERGQITKQVKAQFAGNKEALAQWEQKKKTAIMEMKNKASQDASVISGEIKEVVSQQQQSTEAIQTTTSSIATVDTPPPVSPTSEKASLGTAIGNEAKKLREENQQLGQHVAKMGEATQAEQAKILVSENLAKVLAKETTGIESSNQALSNHIGTVEAAASSFDELKQKAGVLISPDGNYVAEGYLPTYDAQSHSYRNPQGEIIQSSTHVRDVLMGKFNPSFKQDMGVIQKAVAGLSAGQQLTPEMVGMAGNQKAFDFMTKRAYASTEMGNMFHEVADTMAQTGATSLGELQAKPEWSGLSQLINKHLENLAKVGVEYTFENLENNVKAYSAAMKSSGLSPTAFSETPLAFKMTGKNGQSFEFGVTPDQLFSGELGTFLMDSKTGKVGGHESFQLSMQGLAMRSVQSAYLADREGFVKGLSNKQLGLSANANQGDVNAARQNIKNTLDVLANTDLSQLGAKIVNVKNGVVELVDNGLLTMEELFKLFQRFQKIKTGEAQPLNEEEQAAMMNRQRNTGRFYGTHDGSAPSFDGSAKQSSNSKLINSYISNYNQQMRVEERLQKANYDLNGKKGDALISQQSAVKALEQQLNLIKAQAPQLDLINGTLNGQKLTQQEIDALLQRRNLADAQHLSNQTRINAAQKQQVGFFAKLVGGLKNQMTMFIDTSLAYQAIGKIRQSITTLINTTKELDSALVDIQIATGNTRQETRALLITYSNLAKEMGRTTQSVAQASNDWLRAGYEGQAAAELTRASMMLSTLGMIEATEATTYLISTLKGWKISADEVINVVDKLTAVDMAAAISAGDLALAMSRANNSARMAGSDMNKFIGYVTTVADVTQKSAESVGESFKTIYSRFGNVKANKYAATTADINAADYSSDEFENLNDIETVLTKQGIRLRETAGTWREIDAVIEEIAQKWKTWDQTTKNAVATVVAGTRQRENVITLFENWENVSKYAEIAENAYGTATQKMEAYTTSVESSRQRLTVAVEKWALKLDGSDALKSFYDALTYTIENLHILAIVLGGLATIANYDKVSTTAASGLGKLGAKTMGFSNMFAGVKKEGTIKENVKQVLSNTKQSFLTPMENARIIRQQELYGNNLDKLNLALTQELAVKAKNTQSDLLMLEVKDRGLMADMLDESLTQEQVQAKIHELSGQGQYTLAQTLLTNAKDEERVAILQSITADKNEMEATNKLRAAEEALAAELRAQQGKGGMLSGGASNAIGKNMKDSTKTQNTTLGANLAGIGTIVGGILGGTISSTLTSELGPTWQILGSVGGSMIASYAGKSLATGLTSLITTGTFAVPVVGWVAAIATGLGALFAWQKKKTEEAIKESQEAFAEAEKAYSNAKGAGTLAIKIDELAHGVDSLGRNISLTDEEYENFVSYNAQLIEIFPELYRHTDAQGNKFIDLGHNAESAASQVEGLQNALQKTVDAALLNPNVLSANLANAQEQAEKYQKELEEAEKAKSQVRVVGYQGEFKSDYVKKAYEDNVVNKGLALTEEGIAYFAAADQKALELESDLAERNQLKKKYGISGTLTRDIEKAMKENGDYDRYVELRSNLMKYEKNGEIDLWDYYDLNKPNRLAQKRGENDFLTQQAANGQIASYNSQIDYAKYKIKNSNKAMQDEAHAIVRQSFADQIPNWDENQLAIAYLAAEQTTLFADDGSKLDEATYRSNVEDMVIKVNDLIGKNKMLMEYALGLDEAGTVREMAFARSSFKMALLTEFNKDGNISADEKSILVHFGFEYDENSGNWKDTQDKVSALREVLGMDEALTLPEEWGVWNMSDDDFNKVYELAKKGYLSVGEQTVDEENNIYRNGHTSKEVLNNLMANNNMETSKYAAMSYQSNLLATLPSFAKDLEEYYSTVEKGGDNTIQAIGEKFSKLPEFMHQAILQGGERVAEGSSEVAEEVQKQLDQAIVNAQVNTATIFAEEYFSGLELDGYINSWSELADAINQVSDSYEKLKNAQEEVDATGKLSWETTLDLLNTNADYVNVLEFTKEGIKLKTDAEATMMQIQGQVLEANIQAAIAEKQLEIQTLRTQIQEAESGKVTVESTNAAIKARSEEVKSLNAVSQAAAQAYNYKTLIDTGIMGTYSPENIEYTPEEIVYSGDALEAQLKIWKEKVGEYSKVYWEDEDGAGNLLSGWTETWTEGSVHNEIKTLENLLIEFQKLREAGYSGDYWEKNFSAPESNTPKAELELNKYKEVIGAISKEYQQMIAYDEYGSNSSRNIEAMQSQYYSVKEDYLGKAVEKAEELLGKRTLEDIYNIEDEEEFEKYLGYYTQLQDLKLEQNNLDEEEVEDRIKIAELEGKSLATMKELQTELIGKADTYEEMLQYQKDYNALLEKEYQLAKSRRDLIDEEKYSAKGLKENKSLSGTSYFTDMRAQIGAEIAAINSILQNDINQENNAKLTDEERIKYQSSLIALQNELNNLDDKEVEDNIKIAELEGASLSTMKELQESLIESSDSYEEKLQRQKDYNALLEEEYQLIKSNKDLIDEETMARQAYSKNGGSLLDTTYYQDREDQITAEREAINAILKRNEEADNKSKLSKDELLKYQKELNDLDNEEANLDDERIQYSINLLKGQKADLSAVTAQYKALIETADTEEEYYEYYQQYLDAFIEEFDNKISDIQRQIDKLEKSRPQEWRSTVDANGNIIETAESKIKSYYSGMDAFFQDQLDCALEALKNSGDLTEEEIEHLVDVANNALKGIHDNAIAQAEDLKSQHEATYAAVTSLVEEYIDDLNKQKQAAEEAYDKEIEKLQDKEDAIARTNKLIELQNNLLNAQKEKQRVYRAGIGWTYEADRKKVRAAQDELNSFYRQDNIDDLNKAKETEMEIFDRHIKNWENYLTMLQEKFSQWERAENIRLVAELLGVKTEEEIYDLITGDMTNFTIELSTSQDTFLNNQNEFYTGYNSIFNDFVKDYGDNLNTLSDLKSKTIELLTEDDYISGNGGISGTGTSTGGKTYSAMAAQGGANTVYADRDIEAEEEYGYDKYTDYSAAYGNAKSDEERAAIEAARDAKIKHEYGGIDPNPDWKKDLGYSNGILGGPVTYTGLALLHGTPSEPEYVLNNDQAYNLLRYITTKKVPEFESYNKGGSGIQYIVQGDVILEGVDNPEQFWGEVTKAMGNRWNVTKNR